jgi:hypothetical protein
MSSGTLVYHIGHQASSDARDHYVEQYLSFDARNYYVEQYLSFDARNYYVEHDIVLRTELLGWIHTCNVTAYRNTVS